MRLNSIGSGASFMKSRLYGEEKATCQSCAGSARKWQSSAPKRTPETRGNRSRVADLPKWSRRPGVGNLAYNAPSLKEGALEHTTLRSTRTFTEHPCLHPLDRCITFSWLLQRTIHELRRPPSKARFWRWFVYALLGSGSESWLPP